jgi:sugar/nucleoside kinase (ribokinase family)
MEGEVVVAPHPTEIIVAASLLGATKRIEEGTKVGEDRITSPVPTEAMGGGVAAMTLITVETHLTKLAVVTLGSSRVSEDVPASI